MPPALILVTAAAFLYMLGLSVIFPVVPQFVRELEGMTDTQAGILISSYAFASFACAPLWGMFSERRGRKPAIAIGMLGFSLAFLAFGLGTTFWELLTARVVGGMIAAAVLPAILAYVADTIAPERRTGAMGVVGAAIGLGVLCGVGFGGFLGAVDVRLPFFATAGIGVLATLGVIVWLPESLDGNARAREAARRKELEELGLTRARLIAGLAPLLGFSFLVQASRSALEVTIGFLVIDRFAGGPRETGILLGFGTLIGVVVQGGVRPLVARFGDRSLMLSGTVVLALALLLIGLASQWVWVLAAGALVGVGAGLVEPTFRSELSRVGQVAQGEAQGLNGSAQSLARASAFLAFPYLYDRFPPAWVFGGAAALSVVAYGLARGGLRASFPSSEVRAEVATRAVTDPT